MIDYDKIITSMPINKQSAMGITNKAEFDSERRALVAQSQYLHAAIKSAKQHNHMNLVDVQEMGRKLDRVNKQIQELKKKEGFLRITSVPDVFMDVCREELSKPQFGKILKETYRRIRGNA